MTEDAELRQRWYEWSLRYPAEMLDRDFRKWAGLPTPEQEFEAILERTRGL
jgi:hypothetical protein